MSVDIKGIVRRAGWNANKRVFSRPPIGTNDPIAQIENLIEQGKYEDAIKKIGKIAGWKSNPLALRMMGLSHLGMEELEEAISCFESARGENRKLLLSQPEKLSVELAKDYVNSSTTHITNQNYPKALTSANMAHEHAPNLVGPFICLLSIFNRQEDHASVRKTLLEIIKDYPHILQEPDFLERLENDPDLANIEQDLNTLKEENKV